MCRSGASPWVALERKPGVIPCVYFLSVRDACCQAAPLTSRVLSSAVGSSGQRGRLQGLTFRRSQVFPSVEKPGLDSQLKKPTSLCEAKPASELFLTSVVLGGSEISNATERFLLQWPVSTQTQPCHWKPWHISRSCGDYKGSYSDAALNSIQILEAWKGFSEAQRAALFPPMAPQKTLKGPEQWRRSIDYHPPPRSANWSFCTSEHGQVRPHTGARENSTYSHEHPETMVLPEREGK